MKNKTLKLGGEVRNSPVTDKYIMGYLLKFKPKNYKKFILFGHELNF